MPRTLLVDIPERIHELLVEEAKRENRSLSEQAVTVLARGLGMASDAKARRRAVLRAIRADDLLQELRISDPVKLIRTDRSR